MVLLASKKMGAAAWVHEDNMRCPQAGTGNEHLEEGLTLLAVKEAAWKTELAKSDNVREQRSPLGEGPDWCLRSERCLPAPQQLHTHWGVHDTLVGLPQSAPERREL